MDGKVQTFFSEAKDAKPEARKQEFLKIKEVIDTNFMMIVGPGLMTDLLISITFFSEGHSCPSFCICISFPSKKINSNGVFFNKFIDLCLLLAFYLQIFEISFFKPKAPLLKTIF